MATSTLIESYQKNVYQNDLSKVFRALWAVGPTGRKAKTPSSQRENLLPNQETTIGQNLRASGEICFCLSPSPDKQNKEILCGESSSAEICGNLRLIVLLRTWRPLRLGARSLFLDAPNLHSEV